MGTTKVIRQTACMVVNLITVNNFASLFGCTPEGWAYEFEVSWLVPNVLALVGPTEVQLLVFFCFSILVIACCRVLIFVSSLYSFDFMVSEMLH